MSRALTAAIAAAVLAGCGGQEAVIGSGGDDVATNSGELSWTQFLSKVHQLPDQDLFIVNGDSTVEG